MGYPLLMAKQAGTLLIKRARLTIEAGATVEIETLLEQQNLNFYPDPPLGGVDPNDVPPGVASRVMVCAMAPIAEWADITHEEPVLDAVTGTIHVTFTNGDGELARTFNVMFLNPHSRICPVNAVTYRADPT